MKLIPLYAKLELELTEIVFAPSILESRIAESFYTSGLNIYAQFICLPNRVEIYIGYSSNINIASAIRAAVRLTERLLFVSHPNIHYGSTHFKREYILESISRLQIEDVIRIQQAPILKAS